MRALLVTSIVAVTSVSACGGCDDEAHPTEVPPEPAPSPPAVAAPRALSTPAAFDLVATGSGAVLVWAGSDGSLKLAGLDASGSERGEARVVARSAAIEVAAASGGGRIGIAWIARDGEALSVMATHGPVTAEALSPPASLGGLDATLTDARGLLAVAAAEDGNIAVMHRERDAPCPPGTVAGAADETCAQFDIHRLGGTTERRGVGLVAPDPCARGAVGYVWTAGVWYYGVCTQRGHQPVTTVYAIQFEPQYAHAETVLEGCEPIGITPGAEGAIVVGRCGQRLDAVSLTEAAQRRMDVQDARPAVTCVDARPRLDLGAISRTLSAPESRLEAMLPSDIAPTGSRAAWTGDALLVASPARGDLAIEVSLRRYQCVGGGLTDQT